MAVLPTKYDLSGPQNLRSGRAIAVADLTPLFRGITAAGESFDKVMEERDKQRTATEIGEAEVMRVKDQIAQGNVFANDTDFGTLPKRANDVTALNQQAIASTITDPVARKRWLANAETDRLQFVDQIHDRGVELERDTLRARNDTSILRSSEMMVDPATPPEVRAKLRSDIDGSIQMGQATGLYAPEAAAAMREKYLVGGDQQLALNTANLEKLTDPEGLIGRLGIPASRDGYFAAIRASESGGSDTAANPSSSAKGRYQFTSGTWADMVRSHPEAGLSPDGVFDPAQQEIAIRLLTADNAKMLANSGIEDSNANLYAAHFLGAGGAVTALKAADGASMSSVVDPLVIKANPFLADMTVGDFKAWTAKKSGGGAAASGPAPEYANLPFSARLQLFDQAQAEVTTRRNQDTVAVRSAVETATANAPTAIQNTGKYDGEVPDIEHFTAAYGPQEGAQRYDQFQAEVDASHKAFDMRTMSSDDIAAVVERAKPTSSGENAALEQATYETLAKAADQTIKARNADPAAYSQQAFPEVAAAWANAQQPGGYQTALATTAAAQQQLGIENMKLLPDTLATDATKKFNDIALPEADRVASISQLVLATPDPGQRRAVFDQLVASGLPAMTEGAVNALERGDNGAAQRLFQAAMVDPSKLPGQIAEKPADIKAAVQSRLMDQGAVGDIYYGLSNGDALNIQRAQRDEPLITNAVMMRLRSGETLDGAIDGVGKDLFGDVEPISEGNISVLVPKGTDTSAISNGLQGLMPNVKAAIETNFAIAGETPDNSTGLRAVFSAAGSNYAEAVLSRGYFRNAENGYAFIDGHTGEAVAAPDGKPLIFTDDQALAAGLAAAPVVLGADRDDLNAMERAMLESDPAAPSLGF